MASGSDAPASEIRTFLIADVRGYTRFTQQHGDEAAARLAARFAEIARETVESRDGSVVELRGDEALCVFRSPRQAVRAAVAFQQRCAEDLRADATLPLRVGMGLDAGEAVPVEGGYRGGALNLAARLCSIAGPGVVLVSEGVVHLGSRVDGVTYVDRGEVRLKGMERPVRYHEATFPLDLPEPDEPGRRRLGRGLIVAGAVVLAAALVGSVVLATRGSSTTSALAGNSVGEFDAHSGKLVSQTRLRDAPSGLAVGLGSVWVGDPALRRVVGIDLSDGSVTSANAGAGGSIDGIAVSHRAVWAVHGDNASVVRIDPRSLTPFPGEATSVGAGASAAVSDGDDVWVLNTDEGTAQKIDGATGEAAAPLAVGPQPVAVASGLGSVWVLDEAGGTVTEIDPRAGRVVGTTPVVVGGTALATGFGAIWIADPPADAVIRLDPRNPAALRQVRVPGGPGAVAVAGGSVWAGTASGMLYRISPDDLTVESSHDVSAPVTGLAGEGDRLFATAQAPFDTHRGGTLNVVGSGIESLDPAVAYSTPDWSVLSITNDGLVGFRRVGGATGSLLVPDLATAIPEPTDGGRIYRFVLRRGLRYSTGDPVRAGDMRRAVERALAAQAPPIPGAPARQPGPGGQYFANLVGAAACRPGAACDMSRGVITDDARGTVEFHLAKPDSRFLYALALPFAFPVPGGADPTPDGSDPTTVLPATGAYEIRRFQPAAGSKEGSVELVRNPHFHVWSTLARPDGFPDSIVWRLGASQGDQLGQVERGAADVASDPSLALYPAFDRVARTYPSRTHTLAAGQVLAVFMNTRTAPFDDVRVRRAVNLALDRRRMAAARAVVGSLTCQILPPGIAGYRPYCPYTPGGGPDYRGPDLAAAKALVRASGTAGSAVTVLLTDVGPQAFLRYAARVLERLGYRVRTKFLPAAQYYPSILDPHGTVQFGGYGWLQDYPAPADFLDVLFRCGSQLDPSRFCDPEIDRLMDRAVELDRTDAPAANLLWAEIDRKVTDAAPWVPFVSPSAADFVSARVGNYARNPQWGVLLDQLWVR
ncbi:MAG TPA: ABC transporter substrate-binding protein [Gaiellaceae bacterium]